MLDDIKKMLEENKGESDILNYVKGKVFTPDGVKEYLNGEEGKKIVQPIIDKHFTKGLDTWKENNLSKLLEDEISKRYPAETPEQKQLKELQMKLEQIEKEKTRESLRNKAFSYATEKGLPVSLVDHFLGQDENSTVENLAKFQEVWSEAIKGAVEGKFKQEGRKPHQSGGNPTELEKLKTEYDNAKTMSERVNIQLRMAQLKKGE